MGPFLAGSSGETAEWCDSGVEGWRRQEERGRAKDKEAGERAERREKKRKSEGGGYRRQVLISNRLLVMRSLSNCSQIDVM